MSEEVRPYRGFTEDGKKYYIGEDEFDILSVNAKKLFEWKNQLMNLTKGSKNIPMIQIHDQSEKLSKDILITALKDFNYDTMTEKCHPKELEGAAGNLYAFLYEMGSPRETSLLMKQLTETQKH